MSRPDVFPHWCSQRVRRTTSKDDFTRNPTQTAAPPYIVTLPALTLWHLLPHAHYACEEKTQTDDTTARCLSSRSTRTTTRLLAISLSTDVCGNVLVTLVATHGGWGGLRRHDGARGQCWNDCAQWGWSSSSIFGTVIPAMCAIGWGICRGWAVGARIRLVSTGQRFVPRGAAAAGRPT